MDLGKEYSALCKLAKTYDTMSSSQQHAYDRRLGAWMLAADITTVASCSEAVVKMRQTMAAR
jgi:hypothetical protein